MQQWWYGCRYCVIDWEKQCSYLLDNAVQVDNVVVDSFPRVGKICYLVHLPHHVVRHLAKPHLTVFAHFYVGWLVGWLVP